MRKETSMRYALIGAVCVLASGSVGAMAADGEKTPLPLTGDASPKSAAPGTEGDQATPAPDRRADSVPPTGVVRPVPDATRDTTVKQPNVDPGMAIAPPGTPGSGVRVNPK
jgi:hypothetical protein